MMLFHKTNRKSIFSNPTVAKITVAVLVLFAFFLQNYQLTYSTLFSNEMCFGQSLPRYALNLVVVAFFTLLPAVFLKKWSLSLYISSVFLSVYGLVNYFVTVMHGAPFVITDIDNLGTAINVLQGYHIPLGIPLLHLLACALVGCATAFAVSRIEKHFSPEGLHTKRLLKIGFLAVDFLLVAVFLLIPSRLCLELNEVWSWRESVSRNGYAVYSVLNAKYGLSSIQTPEGYDPEKIALPEVSPRAVSDESPDVIFILNESFYDISAYGNYKIDNDYLADFYNIPNAIYGKCYGPAMSTNNSEFEFLTSNLLLFLKNGTPFNYIDFTKQSTANATSYFEKLGYTTSAFHWGSKANYNRERAYRDIGFDTVVLGSLEYQYDTNVGNRVHTDEDDYRQLEDVYAQNSGQKQFMFLVTYQNHGGYTQNDAELDTHHLTKDVGEATEEINEFISSVALSAKSFRELTEYYSQVERPVVICMVGDHAPAFLLQTEGKYENGSTKWARASQTLPYVIWSNRPLETADETAYANMTDLLPLTLNAANLPLSPWYEQMLQIHNLAPARCDRETYLDADGKAHKIADNKALAEQWKNYQYMEYNNMVGGKNFNTAIFDPVLK